MKTMEADVIVVAAGPAGLAAAITAGENDLKAIVFEKSNTTGGAANMGMGPLGIGTKYQKKAFCDITVDEALNKHMEYTHYRVDSDLVQTYFNKSADTIEWLEDMGVEFAGAFRYFRESEATWHIVKPENGVIGPRAAGPMVRAMTEKAKELGVTPMATWVAGALGGVEPEIMGVGPVASTKKVLAKTGLTIDDMDLIEANEAFAAQSLAVAHDLKFDMDKVNVNGGAIALGHPVGASGCRILVTLLHEMQAKGAKTGLATLCIGGGMGCSTVVKIED